MGASRPPHSTTDNPRGGPVKKILRWQYPTVVCAGCEHSLQLTLPTPPYPTLLEAYYRPLGVPEWLCTLL